MPASSVFPATCSTDRGSRSNGASDRQEESCTSYANEELDGRYTKTLEREAGAAHGALVYAGPRYLEASSWLTRAYDKRA